MARRLIGCCLCLGIVCAGVAQAQSLTDPTRPPGGSAAPVPGHTSVEEVPAGTQLQSVLIAAGRRVAVINGTTVPLGGMVGEAKVIKISETEVVLRRGTETEVLKMYPGIDKQATKRRIPRHGGAK